jgi:hypothetical protein
MLQAIAVSAVVFVAGCTKDDLTFVKKGHTSFNKSVAIGDALDGYKYFGKKEWLTEKTPQGARLVIFKADMNPQFIKEINEACGTQTDQGKRIESQKWSIQFTINKADAIYVSGTQTLTISTDKAKKSGSLSEALLKSVYENKLAAVCM